MRMTPARFAIGTLSKGTGCKVETIRYYERAGLLPAPPRSPGGYRLYGTEHLKRLAFVRRARSLGFSIGDVRRLLDLADHHQRPCAEARRVAASHLADVRARIADLKVMEGVLKDTVARCGQGTGPHCPIIEALYREEPGAGPPDVSDGASAGAQREIGRATPAQHSPGDVSRKRAHRVGRTKSSSRE